MESSLYVDYDEVLCYSDGEDERATSAAAEPKAAFVRLWTRCVVSNSHKRIETSLILIFKHKIHFNCS